MLPVLALLAATLGIAVAAPAPPHAIPNPCPTGCMNFAINVHDIVHVSDSADTVLHLIDLFSRNGVKGEFYLTGPITQLYLDQRPDVIAKLKSSGMTISYHVRAPHPLVDGFDRKLAGLTEPEREAVLRDYETYGLDLRTGELDRARKGGYTLVRDTFGSSPVAVVAPNADHTTRVAGWRVYKSLGAQMGVWYHGEGATIENPLEHREGLLVRPSDFSITKWGPGDEFWWNHIDDPAWDPTTQLERRIHAWSEARAPFVTALIHENNFYRYGPESWTLAYYTNREKTAPLAGPWTLTPREVSRVLTPHEQASLWNDYEALVKWSVAHMRVVTGAELVAM